MQKKLLWKILLYQSFVFAMLVRGSLTYAITFDNPVGSSNFPALLDKISGAIIPLALLAATVGIVIAGFKYITASVNGDQKKIAEAHQWFLWTIVGASVVIGAKALSSAALNFAKDL